MKIPAVVQVCLGGGGFLTIKEKLNLDCLSFKLTKTPSLKGVRLERTISFIFVEGMSQQFAETLFSKLQVTRQAS